MRRNFYELATPGPAHNASEALHHIAEFYAIEKDISGRRAARRRLVRQNKSRPPTLIRPIALNRKNALFAGSDGGAEYWAIIASLFQTCKLNDVEPLVYLTDVPASIANDHRNSRIDQLLPWAYRRQDINAVA